MVHNVGVYYKVVTSMTKKKVYEKKYNARYVRKKTFFRTRLRLSELKALPGSYILRKT